MLNIVNYPNHAKQLGPLVTSSEQLLQNCMLHHQRLVIAIPGLNF